jgi:hypothetical protein
VGDDLDRFFGEYQSISLTELDLGTVALPGVLTPAVQVAGENAVCFPKNLNPDYYSTNGASVSYSGYMNDYGSAYTAARPKVPMLFVKFLLQRIAALTGVTLSGTLLDHPTWSELILTNWRALDGAAVVTVNKDFPA